MTNKRRTLYGTFRICHSSLALPWQRSNGGRGATSEIKNSPRSRRTISGTESTFYAAVTRYMSWSLEESQMH